MGTERRIRVVNIPESILEVPVSYLGPETCYPD
jgi:hypothetical protein